MLAIAAPGVLCAAALGGWAINERQDDSGRAHHTLAVSDSLGRADELVHQLQRERSLQIDELINGPAAPSTELTVQIGQTDSARKALERSLNALLRVPTPTEAEGVSAEITKAISGAIKRVDTVRANSGATITPRTKLDSYTDLITPVLAASRSLALTDPHLGRDIGAMHWLSEATEAESFLGANAVTTMSEGGGKTWGASDAAALIASFNAKIQSFEGDATFATAQRMIELQKDGRFAGSALESVVTTPPGATVSSGDIVAAQTSAIERTTTLHELAGSLLTAQQHAAEAVAADARAAVRNILIAVGAALTIVVGLALAVAGAMNASLRNLSRTAKLITDRQLPAMVDVLRGQGNTIDFPRNDANPRDEFGEVANALDALGRMATVVTAQQSSAVRKGIGDIFVNLARRNQTLLDRQIEFIDRLESNEEDPDQLDNLFKLDHLATRMRRNAESLLVLAGAEAPRKRDRRVSMTDVIRVAIGEVEDFDRILMPEIDEVFTDGATGVDLAHLLSEIMENGTSFSPPDRLVEVVGHLEDDGRYTVSVTDHGIGMSTSKIGELTHLLADPPKLGLTMSRSLGFVVVATLAARHDIEVVISHETHADSGLPGTKVSVHIPACLVTQAAPISPVLAAPAPVLLPPVRSSPMPRPAVLADAPDLLPPVLADADIWLTEPVGVEAGTPVTVVTVDASWWFPDQVPTSPEPTTLDERLPEGDAFETGIYGLLDRTPPVPGDGDAEEELPQRRPGAGIEPVSSQAGPSAGGSIAAPSRRPDEIRAVLSRYRGGLAAGRAGGSGSGSDSEGGSGSDSGVADDDASKGTTTTDRRDDES